MRTIDDAPRVISEINPEKVGFVIVKARELLSEDDGLRADASNATDDDERAILTDSADAPIRAELKQYIEALDEEETAALVALLWVGRGDFEREEWDDALNQARARRESPTASYLFGEPLLPDYLEEGLDVFGYSREDFEPQQRQ